LAFTFSPFHTIRAAASFRNAAAPRLDAHGLAAEGDGLAIFRNAVRCWDTLLEVFGGNDAGREDITGA
jgi:hypothetical protein